MMKRTLFWGVSSRRSRKSSKNHSISTSSALVVGAYTWITVILNGYTLVMNRDHVNKDRMIFVHMAIKDSILEARQENSLTVSGISVNHKPLLSSFGHSLF